MKYAISSHQAMVISATSLPYLAMRSGFESLKEKFPPLGRFEGRYTSLLLRMSRSDINARLVGPKLFDAVELHLTDPRIYYNNLDWVINEKAIKLVRGPISSFHAHVEMSPLMKRWGFNLADASPKTRKAVRSQLETAYRVMRVHPELIVADNPVFVFHAGMYKSEADRDAAFARTRENVEFIALLNEELYARYGRDRKITPTIENSPIDKPYLCQTVDEWKRMVSGFGDAVQLTLDYGHLQTVAGEKEKLLAELKNGSLGDRVVNLHVHYSPEVNHKVYHAHGALSKIPQDKIEEFRNDLSEIMKCPGLRHQGYITLEVPSGELLDYVPSLAHMRSALETMRKRMQAKGLFDWSAYRGTIDDQLAGLAITRDIAASVVWRG